MYLMGYKCQCRFDGRKWASSGLIGREGANGKS